MICGPPAASLELWEAGARLSLGFIHGSNIRQKANGCPSAEKCDRLGELGFYDELWSGVVTSCQSSGCQEALDTW